MFEPQKIVDDLTHSGLSIIEHMFEEDLLESLYHEILINEQENHLQNAKIGRLDKLALSPEIRRDKIKWLDSSTEAQKLFFTQLEHLRVELNKNLMLGLFDVEAHYAVYQKGDFYKKHLDSFKGSENRIISIVIYLNQNWHESDGGSLHIYQNMDDQAPLFSVAPTWGKTIMFLSEEIPHEVQVSNKTRYSIAVWFRVRKTL